MSLFTPTPSKITEYRNSLAENGQLILTTIPAGFRVLGCSQLKVQREIGVYAYQPRSGF